MAGESMTGNPTERKIFELAKTQADRDATIELNRCLPCLSREPITNPTQPNPHISSFSDWCMYVCMYAYSVAHRDTRELAFQQVQTALALKDLELARLQQGHTHLVAEVADLRRVAKREGVNMDYLKVNIL
jgi:hypothetical protein